MHLKTLLILFYQVFYDGLKRNRLNIIRIILLTIAASICGIIGPYLLHYFIDYIIPKQNVRMMMVCFAAFAVCKQDEINPQKDSSLCIDGFNDHIFSLWLAPT